MSLLKIGCVHINLDRVTAIVDRAGSVRVYFDADDCITCRGADADAIRTWLAQSATTLNP